MSTLIIQHDDCKRHDPGPGHPEQVRRIDAVLGGLEGLKGLEFLPAPLVSAEQANLVHPQAFQQWLQEMEPEEGRVPLSESDNLVNRGSNAASARGSGAVCFAIDQLLAGKARNAFCVTRPPGHHSGVDFAMGFCLYNHVAIGARHAQNLPGISKVAILDFDVHHGNGTQQIFEADPSVMFVSSHQLPLYPGSGHMDETGVGNILNLPLPPGAGSSEFRKVWGSIGLPAVHAFQPDLLLVSAGFDAHQRDPLGHLEVLEADYRWITSEILDLADDSAGGRVVSILEGGYDLSALSSSARAHAEALVAAR
jgi:acetoin utilization deacetylase AcuC-like enzyme